MATATAMNGITNGAAEAISFQEPYIVTITIEGIAPLLFHRWDVDAIEEKAKAAKNSAAKKTDNIESFVYRLDNGNLALPSEYLRMSIVNAAKYKQDPRSPRKSAMDLFKAGVVGLTESADLGVKDYDYLDRRRVMVQRNGITRTRPAMHTGWKATFDFTCLTPEYIAPQFLNEVTQAAGRLVGVGDFRPTFGRFQVVKFELQ